MDGGFLMKGFDNRMAQLKPLALLLVMLGVSGGTSFYISQLAGAANSRSLFYQAGVEQSIELEEMQTFYTQMMENVSIASFKEWGYDPASMCKTRVPESGTSVIETSIKNKIAAAAKTVRYEEQSFPEISAVVLDIPEIYYCCGPLNSMNIETACSENDKNEWKSWWDSALQEYGPGQACWKTQCKTFCAGKGLLISEVSEDRTQCICAYSDKMRISYSFKDPLTVSKNGVNMSHSAPTEDAIVKFATDPNLGKSYEKHVWGIFGRETIFDFSTTQLAGDQILYAVKPRSDAAPIILNLYSKEGSGSWILEETATIDFKKSGSGELPVFGWWKTLANKYRYLKIVANKPITEAHIYVENFCEPYTYFGPDSTSEPIKYLDATFKTPSEWSDQEVLVIFRSSVIYPSKKSTITVTAGGKTYTKTDIYSTTNPTAGTYSPQVWRLKLDGTFSEIKVESTEKMNAVKIAKINSGDWECIDKQLDKLNQNCQNNYWRAESWGEEAECTEAKCNDAAACGDWGTGKKCSEWPSCGCKDTGTITEESKQAAGSSTFSVNYYCCDIGGGHVEWKTASLCPAEKRKVLDDTTCFHYSYTDCIIACNSLYPGSTALQVDEEKACKCTMPDKWCCVTDAAGTGKVWKGFADAAAQSLTHYAQTAPCGSCESQCTSKGYATGAELKDQNQAACSATDYCLCIK